MIAFFGKGAPPLPAKEGTTLEGLREGALGYSFDPIHTSSEQKRSFMFRRFGFLLAGITLVIAPLQAGTIHEVFNQTYTGTAALGATDLLTPPAVDRSYLVTIYYSISGKSSAGVKDTVRPYFTWTDDVGTEQLGDGICPWNENGTPKKCSVNQTFGPWLQPLQAYGGTVATQTNAGPLAVTFPVRMLANTHLTLTIPVTNPDNLTYQVSVQVQGW
jgi:hypothetical protein